MNVAAIVEGVKRLCPDTRSVPNISGRCAIFAKTDIIHRQHGGVHKQDILMGLCTAMIRNYESTIVKSLPVKMPKAFCGGVTFIIVSNAKRAVTRKSCDLLLL